jgi:hypothetical protein
MVCGKQKPARWEPGPVFEREDQVKKLPPEFFKELLGAFLPNAKMDG